MKLYISIAVSLTICCPSAGLAAPFVAPRDAQCAAFSPDGKLVATGISGMSNEEFPPRPHPNPRKCAVIQIWDVASGQRLRRMETYGDVTKVRFSPDGLTLAVSRLFSPGDSAALHEVRLWEVSTGKSLHVFHGCHGFDFAPDGQSLAVISRSRCFLYDVATLEKLREMMPLGGALSATFSPDGKHLAGIGQHQGKFAIYLCDPASGELLRQSMQLDEPFYSLAVSPDNRILASGHERGNILLWNLDDLQVIRRLQTGDRGLQHPFFSPDGSLLAAGNQEQGDVVFWDLATGNELRRYTFKQGSFRTYARRAAEATARPEKDPHRFAFSPDGAAFVAGCYGGIIRLISTGQDVRRFGD